MDILSQAIVTTFIGGAVTVITTRIILAELKKDIIYLKSELVAVKEEKKKDIEDLKQIIKDNNTERKEALFKMEKHIEQIFTTLTDIQVQMARITK